jgi:hypothetical protein
MERKRNIQPETERRKSETAMRRALSALLPPEPERRTNPRFEAVQAQSAESVRLVDLSAHGCCIGFARKADFRPGQFIRLGLPGEAEAVRAIVRWVEDLRIGAEFTRSLPSDRIDRILGESRNPMVALI